MTQCSNNSKEHYQVIVPGNSHERDKYRTHEQADTYAHGETF